MPLLHHTHLAVLRVNQRAQATSQGQLTGHGRRHGCLFFLVQHRVLPRIDSAVEEGRGHVLARLGHAVRDLMLRNVRWRRQQLG